jgi:hypothetical protein
MDRSDTTLWFLMQRRMVHAGSSTKVWFAHNQFLPVTGPANRLASQLPGGCFGQCAYAYHFPALLHHCLEYVGNTNCPPARTTHASSPQQSRTNTRSMQSGSMSCVLYSSRRRSAIHEALANVAGDILVNHRLARDCSMAIHLLRATLLRVIEAK